MKIKLIEFVRVLDSLQPGLAKQQETVEQSSCFAFRNGTVVTYNDEVACSRKNPLKVEGAVPAKKFLEYLHSLEGDEEELEVSQVEGGLQLRGRKGNHSFHFMEREVSLPLDALEQPKTWQPLPDGFLEAVQLVSHCTSKKDDDFAKVCVHLCPKWVEACDGFQLMRYRVRTGLTEPTLVRGAAARHFATGGFTQLAETPSWLHFRDEDGLVLSCRRYVEPDYPDLGPTLKVEGTPARLPRWLEKAVKKASIFSSSNADHDSVQVTLTPGKCKLKGEGSLGWYSKRRKLDYSGPPLTFLIAPALLERILARDDQCVLTAERLKMSNGPYTYVSCLGVVDG